MVETVRGQVSGEALGRTLMHEHIFVSDHELEQTFPTAYALDVDAQVAHAAKRVVLLAEVGFTTLVDLTVLGLGRKIKLIQRVAELTTVNIIVATGAYVLRDLPHPLQLRGPGRTMFGGTEPMVELFVNDITCGIAGTGVKAAILKCATDRFGLTKDVERTLRATARAQLATGVPISTHTNAAKKVGLDQQRVFAEEGVDLRRVVIGHSGDSDDLDYLMALLEGGSYLGMDRFGLDYFLTLEKRIQVVAELCARGFADRLVLSHDSCCANIAYSAQEIGRMVPDHDLTLIYREVLPGLRRHGVSEEQIQLMLVENPRRILSPDSAG